MAYSRIRFEIQNSATMTLVQLSYIRSPEIQCFLAMMEQGKLVNKGIFAEELY